MKVLVADPFPQERLSELKSLGLEVDYRPELTVKELPEAAASVSILVVRGKQVSAEVLERSSMLSLVIRAGAGVNTIDVGTASRRGIYVANCPGQNAIAVAELVMGLMTALDRRIPDNVSALRSGKWEKKSFGEARGLYGRTLGVLGLGSIGREVVKRGQSFGMRLIVWSRSLDETRARELGVERCGDAVAVARESDVLSVHLPLTSETRGIVSRQVLEALRPGSCFINAARAELVDQAALLDVARLGRIRVGLDVYEGEPEKGQATFEHELAKLPNVYGTHHIGASTDQAQAAVAREVVRIVESFAHSGVVPNCVNIARRSPAKARLVVRHLDRVGVLANVLGIIREAGINVQEVHNTVFDHAEAACCTLQLDERPPPAMLERIRARREEIIFAEGFDI